jgi:hypothetical protein
MDWDNARVRGRRNRRALRRGRRAALEAGATRGQNRIRGARDHPVPVVDRDRAVFI